MVVNEKIGTEKPENLKREFGACLGTMLFYAMGGGAFLLLIVGFLEKRGAPVTEIGSVMSLLSIVEGSVCLLAGHFYKGKGTRKILFFGLLLNGTGSLILAIQPQGVLVWAAALLTGAGFGVFTVIMYVAALQRRPPSLKLGLAVGLYTASIAAGNGLGALMGGWATDRYGFTVSFGISVTCYLLGILGLFSFSGKTTSNLPDQIPEQGGPSPVETAKKSVWVLALLTAFSLSSVNMVFDILFPVYTLRAGMSFTLVGSLSGIKMVLAALVRPFSGALMARINPIRLNNWSLVGLSLGTAMIPFVGMGIGLAAIIALMGAAFGSIRTTSATLVVKDESNPQVVSRRISYYNTCLTLGQTISPWLIGLIADKIELTTSLMVVPAFFLGIFGVGSIAIPRLISRIGKTDMGTDQL